MLKKYVVMIYVLGALFVAGIFISFPSSAHADKSVGTWLWTWWTKTTDYDWIQGHGTNSTTQLLGDVTGDGKDDAVVNFNKGGWFVSASDGSNFQNYSQWATGLCSGSSQDLLADVNGDGKMDAVCYYGSTGTWVVGLSSGTGFNTATTWQTGFGTSSSKVFMGDVDGDGKADAIIWDPTTGEWDFALSSGSSFGTATYWSTFGSGSGNQLIADFNGDHKADIVVIDTSLGNWDVGLSDGTTIPSVTRWISGYGAGSSTQLVGDATDDGKADAVVFTNDGKWYTAQSKDTYFDTPILKSNMVQGFGAGSDKQFIGNTYGNDGGINVYGATFPNTRSFVAFYKSSGWWQVQGINHYTWKNRWEGGSSLIQGRLPLKAPGVFGTYDQMDDSVVDFQIAEMSAAGIDYVIFDETNNIHVDNDALWNRAIHIAQRIQTWNSNPSNRKMKYAFAVGGSNFSGDPATFEAEAGDVYNGFVNQSFGGPDNYYYVNGKPLIVFYTWHGMRVNWETMAGSKTNSDHFTVRFAEGNIKLPNYYGWYNNADTGALPGAETMFITPRKPTASNIFNVDMTTSFFKDSWNRAVKYSPDSVVVGQLDDFGEGNMIGPTDTSQAPSALQYRDANGQLDPYLFWNVATDYINRFKNTDPSTRNVASSFSGAVATASSTYSNLYDPSSAIDGDRKGVYWGSRGGWNDATSNSYPDWLQVDFNGSQTISEIDVFTLQDNIVAPIDPTLSTTFSNYGITDFDVQYWDGSVWTTVYGGVVTGNNKVWRQFQFDPVTTDKIRVVVNAAHNNYSRIVELEAWTKTNVALAANGGSASASSTYSGSYPVSAINNGDRTGTSWGNGGGWNDATYDSYPDWVQVDFNGNKSISEIDVITLQDSANSGSQPWLTETCVQYCLKNYDVQYWDGSSWVTVPGGSVSNNDKVWRKFTFSPVTTNKIRVSVSLGRNYYSRIVEVEAWQ